MSKIKLLVLSIFLLTVSLSASAAPDSSWVEMALAAHLRFKLHGSDYELTDPYVKVSHTRNLITGAKNMLWYLVDDNPYITRRAWIYIYHNEAKSLYSYHCNVSFDEESFLVHNCGIYLNGYPCSRGLRCPDAPLHPFRYEIYPEMLFKGKMN